jgi:hypothetical protein
MNTLYEKMLESNSERETQVPLHLWFITKAVSNSNYLAPNGTMINEFERM